MSHEPDYKAAFLEWIAKTDWVQEQQSSFPFRTLGIHRADVMRQEIERLRETLAARPVQQPAPVAGQEPMGMFMRNDYGILRQVDPDIVKAYPDDPGRMPLFAAPVPAASVQPGCGCFPDQACDVCGVPVAAPVAGQERKAVDMILFCPVCHVQHIDAPDDSNVGWSNPPHRSHLCHECGYIWRPADVATNGVRAIKTKGSADSPKTDSGRDTDPAPVDALSQGAGELPPLPAPWGTMYGRHDGNSERDGYTADQMRGYAIDYALAAHPAASVAQGEGQQDAAQEALETLPRYSAIAVQNNGYEWNAEMQLEANNPPAGDYVRYEDVAELFATILVAQQPKD